MKYLPLLWANLRRKRLRTALTFACVVVAFLLFGVLEAVEYALTGGAELAGQDRLVTQHRVSLIQYLPLSYLERIRAVDGVRFATSQDWFGGLYQDDRNQLNVIAADAASFVDVYAEYGTPDQKARGSRTAPARSSAATSPRVTAGRSATWFRCAPTFSESATAAIPGISPFGDLPRRGRRQQLYLFPL